jgi:hypothetical protein
MEHIKLVWFDKNGVTREAVSVGVNTTDEASKLVTDLLLVMNPMLRNEQSRAPRRIQSSSDVP